MGVKVAVGDGDAEGSTVAVDEGMTVAVEVVVAVAVGRIIESVGDGLGGRSVADRVADGRAEGLKVTVEVGGATVDVGGTGLAFLAQAMSISTRLNRKPQRRRRFPLVREKVLLEQCDL